MNASLLSTKLIYRMERLTGIQLLSRPPHSVCLAIPLFKCQQRNILLSVELISCGPLAMLVISPKSSAANFGLCVSVALYLVQTARTALLPVLKGVRRQAEETGCTRTLLHYKLEGTAELISNLILLS